VTFLLVAALIGFAAAGQVGAARSEEADGHLDHLLARPLSRARWLAGRLGLAAVLLVVAGFVAGLFTWLGAASQHAGVGLGSTLAAGANAAAPAVFFVGLGALLLGVRPRACGVVV